MKEQVFDFKVGNPPYKVEKVGQYNNGLISGIENIIRDVNESKINYRKGQSGTSGGSGSGSDKNKNKVKIKKIVNGEELFNDNVYNYHEDFMDMLIDTYESDRGFVIKPDFIWFTILCEITQYINVKPDEFRKYFTKNKEGKEDILVPGIHKDGYVEPPIDLLTQKVLEKVPSDFTEDMIVPKFSTLTDLSEMAFKSTFLESMSNYYSYGMYACGFSRIKVLGTIEDYQLMITTLEKIISVIPEFTDYFNACIKAIEEIIENFENKYFWHHICWTEHGYGTHTVDGWFTKFFRMYDGKPKGTEMFNKHISKVPYRHIETGDEYIMYVGLLTSTFEDGCYVPEFTKVITRFEFE